MYYYYCISVACGMFFFFVKLDGQEEIEADQPFDNSSSASSSDDEQQETLACAAKEGGTRISIYIIFSLIFFTFWLSFIT